VLVTTIIVYVCACLMAVLSAQQVGRAPLEMSVLEAPTVATALGRSHLVYEVHLTNFGAESLTLDRLDVLGDVDVPLSTLGRAQLSQRLLIVGRAEPGASALPPGARAVAYLWVSLAPGQHAPRALAHRFSVSTADGHAILVSTTPVPVRAEAPAIGPPVEGGPWVAVRGPANSTPHRLSLVTTDGRVRIPQRFAIDWARLGDDGLLFHGDGTVLEHWYGYDAPVYAVAEGTVALVRDGAPDRQPLDAAVAAATVEAIDAPGNVVVIDIGGGRFAAYAHLRPGSIRVTAGAHVAAGALLARIGNSGNALGPHLHFQVADAVEPLAGEGLPFALRAFTLIGRVPSVPALIAGAAWAASPSQPAREVAAELPLEKMVVRFGLAGPR
jgi:murein DD-endopeptidase MepM/ murein hydrolase activator NlpD